MAEIVIYRYGHRPARDKRITTHVALTARAMGASSIIIDTGDRGIEENIVAVNRNFGGHFKVQTGVSIERFFNSLGNNDLLVHLTMYGKPIMEKIEEIKEASREKDRIVVFVGAEKVPGIAYAKSNFNISVTSQPISEVSALAIFLDRFLDGNELKNEMKGRLDINPNERGKTIEYFPDGRDCMEILLNRGADDRLIEHCVAVNEVAIIISEKVDCDRRVVNAASLLHDVGRTVTNDIKHALEGYRICEEEHISKKISEAVLKHTGAGITRDEAMELGLPDLDFMPETIEEKIVACADNLVIGNRRIDINEQVQRYKNKGLDKAATRIKELYEYVSSEAKMDINEIEI